MRKETEKKKYDGKKREWAESVVRNALNLATRQKKKA